MVDRQGDPERAHESQHQQSGQQGQQGPPQQGQPQQQGRPQQGGQPSGMTSRQPPQQPRGQQPQPSQRGQQPQGQPQQSGQQGPMGQQQGMSQQPPAQTIQQPSQQQAPQQSPPSGGSQPQQQSQQPGQQLQQPSGGIQQPGRQVQQSSQQIPQPGQQMQPGGPARGQQATGGPTLEPVPLDEVLQTDVVTVTEDTDVVDAIAHMDDKNVGSVVVVDDEEKPQGIVTDRKIALSMQKSPDITDRTVGEFTQDEVVTADTEMTIYDAINELSQESIRRLPVVDEDGTLVGIVTLDDIIVLLSMELDTTAGVIEAQSPRL